MPEIGAPSARLYDLSQAWLRSQHAVQAVTCFPNHPTGQVYDGYELGRYAQEEFDGIDVHRNWTYVTPNSGFLKKTLGHASFLPSASHYSLRHMERPDVCIGSTPTFFAAMVAARAARRWKVPFVMEVRDLWPAAMVDLGVIQNRAMIRMLEMWEMWLYRKADRIVTVTERFRSNLIDRGVLEEKVFCVTNGADDAFWTPLTVTPDLKAKYGLKDEFVALYCGAHGISQRLSTVLEAAALLRDQKNIVFMLVGEGAEKAALVAQAKERGLRNVKFVASQSKECVRELYGIGDVSLVPLRDIPIFDTFIPSKMFEIMTMARPIIGGVRGEAAEILERSEGALVIPPEDPDALAQAVRRMAASREERERMGARGREYALKYYTRTKLAADYEVIMKGACAELKAKVS